MRILAAAALLLAAAACGGGGDGGELAQSKSELSDAQIAAALGPEDQSAVTDVPVEEPSNLALDANLTNTGNDQAVASQEEEQ